MKFVHLALAALIAVALAGCLPPSTSHPVGTTAGLKTDPALIGTWKGRSDDGQTVYVHFLKHDDALTILLVNSGDKSEDWDLLSGTTTTLGGHHFLNAQLISGNGITEKKGAPPVTMPVLYTIDAKGTLTLKLMDEKAAKALIKAGKIKGDPGQGDSGDAVITADSKALDAFMQSPAALATFVKPLFVLHKAD